MNTTRDDLKKEIAAAFANISPPRGTIVSHRCRECDRLDEAFKGKHWRDITFEVLADFKDSLPLLTPSAFRFFLPAYMMASLDRLAEADIILESIVWNLTPPIGEHANPYEMKSFRDRVGGFDEKQKEAIRSFLLYMSHEVPDLLSDSDETEALERYWQMRRAGDPPAS